MADDKLQIDITADNSKAIQSLNSLCNALDKLNTKLGRNVNTNAYKNSINGLKSTIDGLNQSAMTFNGQAIQNLNTNLVSLAKTLGKFGNKKPMQASQSITAMSVGIKDLVASMNGLNVQGQAKGFTDLASSISKLGGKNAQQAVTTIPQLTKELRDFLAVMSQAPQVSDNTLRMTNALANLASQGGKVRSATSGLRSYLDYINRGANNSRGGFNNLFNTITSGSKRATSGMKSLSYYFGKFYASYFLLIRALSGFKKVVGYASDLTEVQNIVDNTFGSATQKVEDFSKKSIEYYGMSILTTKQIASQYQAMGKAMGITNKQVEESNKTWQAVNDTLQATGQGYNDAANSVADMSINLTKLAADIGSFYNQEYDQVGKRIASGIYSGQSRALREYGIDLTQATIKEWALTQGIEANFKTMTQAEKTMLRYQYTMSHLQNIQGDFLRTSTSWANVVRVLAQNFQNLGATIGGITINAFRPFLIGINNAILKLNQFAIAISNSLGKIFGWKYQSGGGGGAVTDLEDMADSAGGLSDGLGGAADNAKKLKAQLQGFDQLNVLTSDKDSGSGGSGSGGASSGASGGGSASGGQWVETESIFDSNLDTLGKLGSYISDKLADALESIDWDKVYQGARNFGKGLAEFLNGLITPRLFYDVGETIANTLNTAIYTALEFGKEFDFKNFGESIASSINGFFQNFDFGALAETLNVWVDGLEDTVTSFLDTFDWKAVIEGASNFIGGLELDTLLITIGAFAWRMGLGGVVKSSLKALLETQLATGIGMTTISVGGTITLAFTVSVIGFTVGRWAYDNVDLVRNWSDEVGKWIFGKDFNNSVLEVTIKSLSIGAGTVVLTAGLMGQISLLGTTIGTILSGSITVEGVGISILQLITTDIGAVMASGSFSATGTLIGSGILGGILAAIGGFSFGTWIGEKISGEKFTFKGLADAIRDCFDKELNLSFTGFLESFGEDLGNTKVNQWIFDNLTTPIGDFLTITLPQKFKEFVNSFKIGWKKFWLDMAYATSEIIQPLLDKIADIGKATGLMGDETYNNLKNFHSDVATYVDKSKKELDGYNEKTKSVKDTTEKATADMSGLYAGFHSSLNQSLTNSKTSINGYESSVKGAKTTTSTELNNMSGSYSYFKNQLSTNMENSKGSLSGYESALNKTTSTTQTKTKDMDTSYTWFNNQLTTSMSKGKGSVEGLGTATTDTKGKVDDLMRKSGQTFNINTGSGLTSLGSKLGGIAEKIATIFSFSGRTFTMNAGNALKDLANIFKKAEGGSYYQGTWHAIPQYASGGSPSHGTMFIAGESGAEAVGHINGRTEVLNQSQMASVMYDAVLSGMSSAMARSGSNRVEVVLQGDAQGVFKLVRQQDQRYKNQNGHSAFGY